MGICTSWTFNISESGRVKLQIAQLVLWVICGLLAVWYYFGTEFYVKPVSLSFDGNRFAFERETPQGGKYASWDQELRSSPGECAAKGTNFYQVEDDNIAYYLPNARILPCLPGENEIFNLNVRRSTYFDDWLPMRPTTSHWECQVGKGKCRRLQ